MFTSALRSRGFSLLQRRCFSATAFQRSLDPLRILFCGSDHFSCASLEALHKEHVQNGELIEALDVMVLPPKWAGRGNKELREVPCKSLAEKLGLRIHQRSTFREWEPPEGTNLVIAVSFGLFVPPRILRGAKYGGLNVHPSLLPDLRGPAPVHHALLNGDRWTGVSLQTLDDKAFDHGTVLAQTPENGFPIPDDISLPDVTNHLAKIGAEMLVQGLREGLYIPPHKDVSARVHQGELRHAPKLTKEEAKMDWQAGQIMDAETMERRLRGIVQVFGSIWTEAVDDHGRERRVIMKDVKAVRRQDAPEGKRLIVKFVGSEEKEIVIEKRTKRCLIQWGHDLWIDIGRVTVQGSAEREAAVALKGFMAERKSE